MSNQSFWQRTLAGKVEFAGIGVHSGTPATLSIEPADANTGYRIQRVLSDGSLSDCVSVHHSRVTRTTLCTTLDLDHSVSIATIEHAISALAGLGVDNALITVDAEECPILDGSAAPYVAAILKTGLTQQGATRKYLKVNRQITVRRNDAYAILEPYNGRQWDLEIEFENQVIGRQRMIFDWTPREYAEQVSRARTFGFVKEAKVLRQAGYAQGSSLENSIAVDEDQILNPDGLRFPDEFVRHKLLDAVGDLALGGYPIFGRFKSFKGGHALNALVLTSLLDSEANYEIVSAEDLPVGFESLDRLPKGYDLGPFLRSVG